MIVTLHSDSEEETQRTSFKKVQFRVRKAEPVERSKTRISIVQAVTSHVRFQNGKIEK